MLAKLLVLLLYPQDGPLYRTTYSELESLANNNSPVPDNAKPIFEIFDDDITTKLANLGLNTEPNLIKPAPFSVDLLKNLPNLNEGIKTAQISKFEKALQHVLSNHTMDVSTKTHLSKMIQNPQLPLINRKIAIKFLLQEEQKNAPKDFISKLGLFFSKPKDHADFTADPVINEIFKFLRNCLYNPKDILETLEIYETLKLLKIEVDLRSCPLILWAGHTVICFPNTSPEYKNALQVIKKSQKRDENANLCLSLLLKEKLDINKPLTDGQQQALAAIPCFFSLSPDETQALKQLNILSTVLEDFTEKKTTEQLPWRNILNQQIKIKLESLNKPSYVANKTAQILLNLILQKSGTDEQKSNLVRSWSNFMQDKIEVISHTNYSDIEHEALQTIKTSLECSNKALRVNARDVCLVFKISLNMNQMFSLAVDGLQLNENYSKGDDLVLVVGSTGSGKSTFNNYVAGVEYQLVKDHKLTYFLEPKEDHENLALVGHGRSSKTLYPQLVSVPDSNDHCDSPGFYDNRSEEAAMASLAIPLAVQERQVRAIVLVIAWSQLVPGAVDRKASFGKLNQALLSILKLDNYDNNGFGDVLSKTPIIFVISRPDRPGRNEIFDTEAVHKAAVDHLCDIRKDLEINFHTECQNLQEEMDQIESDIKTLRSSIIVLQNLVKPESSGYFTRLLLNKEVVKETEWTIHLEKFKTDLEQNANTGVVNKVVNFFRELVFESDKEGKIAECTEKWRKEIEQKEGNSDKNDKLDTLKKEFQIANIIPENDDNDEYEKFSEKVFVMRCYKDSQDDQDDELEKFKIYVKNLSKKNIFVQKKFFNFDLSKEQFSSVLSWGKHTTEK